MLVCSRAKTDHPRPGWNVSESVPGSTIRNDDLAAAARPIKVCFISPLGYGLYQPRAGVPYGGAELQFYLLSRELSADPSFEVSVLTTVGSNPGCERIGELTVVTRKAGGRLSGGPCDRGGTVLRRLRGYGAAFWEMYRLFRTIDADVYLHAGAGVEVGAYAVICRLQGRRFVHVVASSVDLQEPIRKVKGGLRWLYPLGLRWAHAVVCRTREQGAWLHERYRKSGIVIRTGHPSASDATAEKSSVLWVGRILPLKQPGMFLDLAERLPAELCTMVMMSDDAHAPLLESVKARASTIPNLRLHENVRWENMGEYFAKAKLFVNTSTHEGFPNTFVEAAMHGTPIVSWTVDPDGVLTRAGIGVCVGGSFERLTAVAADFCVSAQRREAYGGRARAYALEHHTVDRSAGELKALLRSLLR